MKLLSLLAILSVLSVVAFAAPLTDAQKQSELEQLAAILRNQYGPLEYKKNERQIDLEKVLPTYLEKVKGTDNRTFFYLVNQFVAEFNDSHFSSRVNSSRLASLGFLTDLVEGKVVIDSVDRGVLPLATFPFDRGDEIVSLNTTLVATLVDSLASYVGHGNADTKRRTGAMMVAYRAGAICPVPTGSAVVVIRRRGLKQPETVTLTWQLSGEDDAKIMNHPGKQTDFATLSTTDVWEGLPNGERGFRCNGITRIAIPKDATLLMQTPFVAYYHPTAKGNVGYLRIPHYLWNNPATGADENLMRFRQYEFVLAELEKNTVGLILDQDHNCGGSVELVENMVGLFAAKPYPGLEFQFLATRNEYFQVKKWYEQAVKSTFDSQAIANTLKLIEAGWTAGKRMTEKTTFEAGRLLYPSANRYTKPIVMLIDEMSGSGGDAFPAMMQGLGRAVLFGTHTMGAGGHVEEIAPLNYSGNQVRITKSLFYHPNGKAIENNGVTPDVSYAITLEDFVGGYRQYQAAYLKALSALLP